MSDYEHSFIIYEKGYRKGVYGSIKTVVNTQDDTREESFTPLEVRDEFKPKDISTKKIAEEIKAKTKPKDQNPS